MMNNFITLWAVVAHLAMTMAQVPQAACPSDSIYCCIVNFSDTECGQAGAEIDYSVSFPIEPSLDGLPTVNLPVPLTAARVVECKLGIVPYLVLCSESDCAGGDSASRVSDATPGACADPGFFIQAMQIGY